MWVEILWQKHLGQKQKQKKNIGMHALQIGELVNNTWLTSSANSVLASGSASPDETFFGNLPW